MWQSTRQGHVSTAACWYENTSDHTHEASRALPWGGKAHVLCTASGVASLQQMDWFMRTCRDWAEVWIGMDGSAMGGRTMGSSWTDRWPSRVITSRSSAHKSLTGEFWQSSGWGRLWNLHVKQRVEKKTDM